MSEYEGVGVRTLEDTARLHDLDLDKWEVLAFNAERKDRVVTGGKVISLWHTKLRVQPKGLVRVDHEEILDLLKKRGPARKSRPLAPDEPDDLLLELALFDPHFGMRTHEHQKDKYGVDIATARFMDAVMSLHGRARQMGPVRHVVFPLAGDLYDADNPQLTTTKGTRRDDQHEPDWGAVIRRGHAAVVTAIDWLSRRGKVEVIVVPGNHDRLTSAHLGRYLDAYFNNVPDVNVMGNMPLPPTWQYFVWGVNLVGLCHGDVGKSGRLPMLMAVDWPEQWATSKYREIHHGHDHKRQVEEDHGVVIRAIPALSALSPWAEDQGYRGQPGAKAFVWHKTKGLVAILHEWFGGER